AGLLHEAKALTINPMAIVIDHDLQEDSAKIAEETRAKLIDLGYTEVEIRKIKVEKKDGLEASARRARYEALEKYADEVGAVAIFLGHTKDDQAETVLLGLARGSGTRSLSGMAKRIEKYRRPLLSITRSDTEAAC
ncbi:MAG: tRNA lysidine(34) synthetase TilS, partial [Actinomycetales bacterium]